MTVLFESDWVASSPYFYNTRTGKAGPFINDVVDCANLEIDHQGLRDYMDFGYCVFGHTPVRDVHVLPHSSRLIRLDDGTLRVERMEDAAVKALDEMALSEDEIWEWIRDSVRRWEASVDGEIVIPTSGGYDSRILNWMVGDKERIRSFTYGITSPQSASSEVVYAQELSRRLGTSWQQVELGAYHNYLDEWYALYGVSTHAHGMYHFEFFNAIKALLPPETRKVPMLSGHFGDDWAGRFAPLVSSPEELPLLGLTHGMNADSSQCRVREDSVARMEYWEKHRERLEDPRLRVIEVLRHKQVLLSYLFRVPEKLGYAPWCPFLDLRLAAAMLNLPPNRRRDRVWQQDFFRKNGIMVEDLCRPKRLPNTLNMQALDRVPLPPLDRGILSEVVVPDYVDWINKYIHRTPWNSLQEAVMSIRGMGRLWHVFTHRIPRPDRLSAYLAYLVLYPIERLLKSRV